MVKKIVRDPMFLQQKSEPATEADKQVKERNSKEFSDGFGADLFCWL